MDHLDDDAWGRFERDGYLRLGPTIEPEALAGLCQRIDDYMLGRRPADRLMMQLDRGGDYGSMAEMTLGSKGATLDYRKIEHLEHDELYRAFLVQPLFREICARAYGP